MSNFYLQLQNTPSMPDEVHVDATGILKKVCSGEIEAARVEGFTDCEELVASMLERMAAREESAATSGKAVDFSRHRIRAQVLAEAALAVCLGQHRREVES